MILDIDSQTRLHIAQALLETEAVSIITLPSGKQLRVFCHAGHIAVEVIADEKDLFGQVSTQVAEVLHG